MKHHLARLLRCLAWHLDPTDIQQAQSRYREAINHYAAAERELLIATQHRRNEVTRA